MSIFEYTFFQNALLGSLLASIVCGFIGSYIVARRLVFISGGITHASFGGIGLGVLLGVNPVLAAMVFAVASAFGVQWLSHKSSIREDSAIAVFWTFGMSVGIICCFLTPGFMPDLPSFLFGSILAIEPADLWLLAGLAVVVIATFALLYRAILSVAFDATFARSQHLPVNFIEYLMMGLIAVSIVSTLRMVGIVLAISLLTIPQMTANIFTFSFKKIIGLSIVIGWVDCLLGLAFAYWLNVPSGASIIFFSIIVYTLCKIVKRHPSFVMTLLCLPLLTGCMSQKNTARSRFLHAFNAKYNIYYNGAQAYIDGSLEKENGNKDNYTELLPLYYVGNKNSREIGKGNFDRAIEKSKKAIQRHSIKRRPEWTKNRKKTAKDLEWLGRKEYNPFIWKAWMLMGRSQFHEGNFDEAASTFAYMSRLYETQPAIYGKARAWLAKTYVENGWIYDAEDVIRNMQRDSLDWRAVKEWDYTYADYYIHTGDFEKAIPYLRKVIRHEMRRKQKAREWYLLGQLYAALDRKQDAYKAFRHVIKQNPPYELEFNARISLSEVMAKGRSKQMVSKLRRMAASDKNKDYLDQVYYAIGNIYLTDKDTLKAIGAYEQGNQKATRAGIEKGVLLLHLGDLYWAKEKFGDARRCYGEAIGLLDKDRKDYEALSERSVVLDELVPYTDAVQLQDSLQALAKMSESDRNAAIDRVITALKKKEKEERRAQEAVEADKKLKENSAKFGHSSSFSSSTPTMPTSRSSAWYFYNPLAVSQGKQAFQRLWGKRENVDNWQRANRTVVGGLQNLSQMTDEQRDSIAAVEAKADSISHLTDSAQNDPHKREYYLAQIPFTEEQMKASNETLEDGLFHAGVIFKDKLDNLRQSEKYLRRLSDKYQDYPQMDETYYHLFLLYSRKNDFATADSYVERLKKEFPNSQWTALLTDPYFKENATMGVQIEDSLYAATYEAFKADRFQEVRGNVHVSDTRFPTGANRDKFLFISGMSKLNSGDTEGCLADMKTVVEKYPDSRISEMAGMIVNGVNQGRKLHGVRFDLEDVWNRRAVVLNDKDSVAARKFSPERITPFNVMLVYVPDSLNENQLLFEMARYNFTNFIVRNFEVAIDDADGLHRMRVSGFRNYDEAYQYARLLHANQAVVRQMGKAKTYIISDENLALLGQQYSYTDYDKFYAAHFAPLKVANSQLLNEPTEVNVEQEDVRIPANMKPKETDKPELEPNNETDNGFILEDNSTVKPQPKQAEDDGIIIDDGDGQSKTSQSTQTEDDGIVIDDEPVTPVQSQEKSQQSQTARQETKQDTKPSSVLGKPKASTTSPKPAARPAESKQQTKSAVAEKKGSAQEKKPTVPVKKQEEPQKKEVDLEDEYYDLDGF